MSSLCSPCLRGGSSPRPQTRTKFTSSRIPLCAFAPLREGLRLGWTTPRLRVSLAPQRISEPPVGSYTKSMVRPERRVLLTSESLVRVSAGAPGSRPQPKAEMPPVRAGRPEPLKEKGARERAAISSERYSLDKVSAERCLGGPSRSCHGEGNRQQSGPERLLDLPGV
jgi:hypothetical protein